MLKQYKEDGTYYTANKLRVKIDSFNNYKYLVINGKHIFHTINSKRKVVLGFLEVGINDYEKDDERFKKMPKVLVKQIKSSIEIGAELLHIHLSVKK